MPATKHYLDDIIIASKAVNHTIIMKMSLYIHIPFCQRRCEYCDFYSVIYDRADAKSYIDVLCRQIRGLGLDYQSIYIGGGTPSALDIKLLEALLNEIKKKNWSISEFTIEANPESLDRKKIRLFLDSGVSRISIGVQSFCDQKLEKLGRLHSVKTAKDKVIQCFGEGFKNISGDLMFGVEGDTRKSWEKELREALSLPFSHISIYMLTYEKGTPFYHNLKKGKIRSLSESKVAAMYRQATDALVNFGMFHYEISNFCLPGFSCFHNENYWKNGLYTGLGPSAVSYDGRSRAKNLADVNEYVARVLKKESPVSSSETLTKRKRAKETAALKIRTAEGIEFEWFKNSTGFDFLSLEGKAIREMARLRLLQCIKKDKQSKGVKLTPKGFFYCDSVSAAFL